MIASETIIGECRISPLCVPGFRLRSRKAEFASINNRTPLSVWKELAYLQDPLSKLPKNVDWNQVSSDDTVELCVKVANFKDKFNVFHFSQYQSDPTASYISIICDGNGVGHYCWQDGCLKDVRSKYISWQRIDTYLWDAIKGHRLRIPHPTKHGFVNIVLHTVLCVTLLDGPEENWTAVRSHGGQGSGRMDRISSRFRAETIRHFKNMKIPKSITGNTDVYETYESPLHYKVHIRPDVCPFSTYLHLSPPFSSNLILYPPIPIFDHLCPPFSTYLHLSPPITTYADL